MKTNLAMFFYKTGTSFLRVEDEYLRKAFNICRPGTYISIGYILFYTYTSYFNILFVGISLPTRKQLSTNYLDECYDELKNKITNEMPKNICIITDAWTNVNGKLKQHVFISALFLVNLVNCR